MKNHLLTRFLTVLTAGLLLAVSAATATAADPPPLIGVTGTTDLGSVAVGSSSAPQTFNITNNNGASGLALNLTGSPKVAVSGANAGDFVVTAQPASPVAGNGGSQSFTVTFTPGGAGGRTAALSIASNDTTNTPYVINLTGTGTVPVIEVDQPPGTALTNGDTASFGSIAVNSTTSLTFAIKNTGLANLNLTGTPKVAFSGAHAAEYTVTAQPTSPVTPGGSINFTVQFAPLARGTRNATLSIANNDATNAPFTLSLTGAAVAPEIAVEQPPGTNINDNGTRNFGSVVVGATSKLTFIIKNTGDDSLTGLVTTINGTNAADFAVTAAPVPPVGGGGSTTFTVDFTPSAGGARTAAIHITNNDPDGNESPFDINLTGTGIAPASGSDGFGYHLATTPLNGVTLDPLAADVVTATNLVGDDYSQAINLGFTFYFYDKAYTTCAASTNGLICLGGSSTSWSPTGIPSTATPNNFIAPFWTDLVKGAGSSILYTTRGSAPNRVFILQYQDMEEYSNAAGKVSFQVWLYEGSNSIEFQFKSISGFTTTRTVSSGIENSAGTVGIQYFSTTAGSLPAFPDAVMITRPVVVGVESKYLRPNGVDSVDCGTAATGLNPEISTIKAPYGSVRRFEAPQYIYLDQFFAEIPATTPPANAWYRLVNDGYAIDGQVVQGTHTFFTTTLTHDVTVIWRWVLEYAVVITSATGDGGFGNPAPGVGRFWYPKNSQFTAAIDTVVQNDAAGIRIKNTGYTVTSYGAGGVATTVSHTLNSTDARAVTVPLTITTPLQIQWLSSGQVRYRFSASSGLPGQSNTPFDGQAFVKVYDPTGATSTTTFSSGTYTDVWINTDADKRQEVVVGAFYRTADRCFTLVDFPVPPGGDLQGLGSDLSLLTDTAVPDSSPSPVTRVARTHTFNADVLANRTVPTPTDIRWVYQPTVFRAEVPLGTAFDPAATVPALCGTNPVLHDTGPDAGFLLPVGDVPTGRVTGNPLRWDQVDNKLYPVHPGTRQIKWRDKNLPGQTYLIEIVSGYPGAVVNLTSEKENADGSRQGTGPAYVMQTTLQTVAQSNPGVSFPAQYLAGVASPTRDEDAHYHHLFDPVAGRRPPTELDISTADPWKFQELTYADIATDATVNATAAGVPFSAQGAGRSVVLYSYRPNPDEVADGNLTKEKLAVRVIRSSPINPLLPDNPKLVLGRRGLELGGGTAAGGAFGIITAGTPLSVNPGRNFVIDFWLNAKDLRDIPLKLTNCTTSATLPGTTVTCDSTANLVKGMSLSGMNIAVGTKVASITNATSFVLSAPATAAGTALSLTASNKPVTVLSTAGDKLKVTLDAGGSTVTAGYLGLTVTQPLSKAGAAWRHYAIHVFSDRFFGVDLTLLDFYLDGVREEQGIVTALLPVSAPASFDIGTTLTGNSLRFGVNADPLSGLQLDQFRLFDNLPATSNSWLTPVELHQLRTTRVTSLRAIAPELRFSFEQAPANSMFANEGSLANVGVGPVTPDTTVPPTYAGTWAHVDIQEVATRLESTLDNAGFGGSGYVLNAVSNYNADLYNRAAEVGTWGPVFPVNHGQLYTDKLKRLEVAYYENPYLTDPLQHPNVAWPYEAAAYDEVIYPAFGPHKSKAIYIASRIGSEGVDQKGRPQPVFDLAEFSGLQIYNQPDNTLAGYNPNEEHALVAASGRAALKIKNLGDDIPNNPPLAAFALQADINARSTGYSSDPWVLVQVNNLATGEPEMAAYHVFKTRAGTIDFPRPADVVVAATAGLAYESAPNPEDRFLTLDATQSFNFTYAFTYQAYAGDSLIPPYPLNIVIGNVAMPTRGGNAGAQRALWWDVNDNPWVVSGDGIFFYQFHYPFRGDFYLPNTALGTPVAWVPDPVGGVRAFTGNTNTLQPGKVVYNTFWRSDYPKLKRGETLTYQGGEYFNENPGSNGLPALVAMKAAEIVYDVATPGMVIGDNNVNGYSARITRPLDRYEVRFTVAQMAAAGFSPASPSVFSVAERWYFKDLPGSLQRRFYFDSLAEKLVFRGYLNDKDSGNPNLTQGPDPLNILEPNLMTAGDLAMVTQIGTGATWLDAVTRIYQKSMNPSLIRDETTVGRPPVTGMYLAGLRESPVVTQRLGLNDALIDPTADRTALTQSLGDAVNMLSFLNQGYGFNPVITSPLVPQNVLESWNINNLNFNISLLPTQPVARYAELDSFGVGSALVPNPALLTAPADGSRYITIAENNREELTGAPVSLHIIEIIPDRYRGAIKVIEAADAFSERITLQHNGEFGGNTGDLYYEWWIRDAAPLDVVATEVLADGTLKQTDASGHSLWQQYLPKDRVENNSLTDFQKHLGLHSIVFEGRPDVVLADKLILMRYRHKDESNWKLVPFEFTNPGAAWKPGLIAPTSPAPFQWAGAANSPQLQADGSKRYVPQLVMGWVKRVLDRINPYEARYTDFFNNESPATYSSQIQIAGAPFAGKVALNPDKNVIEKTGLIELYETVLARARELSIDNSTNPVSTDAINQALLLAATRLSMLYEILAREAYTDAQDSTITVTDDSGLQNVAAYTFAFQNMEADVMHEELSLLRGTDFVKSYPVYNRMFWNYAKGLGEAAYNVNYNIYDVNKDGFINEDDARLLYPQGHGDAWGHYLSALGMHYTLLQDPNFHWQTRSELYSLMQNVLEVDFLDEKSFARLAAGKARTGRDIVRSTYRLSYTQNPDGQWQGYTDGADPARAWGVSECAHRAGQAAWFDWAVANALLPQDAAAATPVQNPENLDRIDRLGAIDDIGEIAGGLHEIQTAMDEANGGVNPLGFDSDAITFDIDLEFYENASGGARMSHFEQIYERARTTGTNALATLDFAAKAGNKLRYLQNDTDSLSIDAYRQDLDYRNRLIEIFGQPYDGTIGFGKPFPEGYLGPDTQLFAYLDQTKISQFIPESDPNAPATMVTFKSTLTKAGNLADSAKFQTLWSDVFGNIVQNLGVTVGTTPATVAGLVGSGSTSKYFQFGVGSTELSEAFGALINTHTYEDFSTSVGELQIPVRQRSPYAFQAPATWGQRTSYGKVQRILEDELRERIALDASLKEYTAFLQEFDMATDQIKNEMKLMKNRANNELLLTYLEAIAEKIKVANEAGQAVAETTKETVEKTADGTAESLPSDLPTGGVAISPGDALAPARGVAKIVSIVTSVASKVASVGFKVLKAAAEWTLKQEIWDLKTDENKMEDVSKLQGMLVNLVALAGKEGPLRDAIGAHLQALEVHKQEYITAQSEGFRLMRERDGFNKILASKVQKNRYQDMIFRLARNEAMTKYQASFNNAARYTWLAARAYDYETSLDPGHPAAPGALMDRIVKERQLGLWDGGQPQVGQGGLAEILCQLNANFQTLKGQLGINNPQSETEKISLRQELFRIGPGVAGGGTAASDARWVDAIKARIEPDLNQMPEFIRYCRPFADPASGPQPGIVIRFPTVIEPGRNFFGQPLAAGDHNYSTANFATKIRSFGVWLDNYNAAGLATSPRAYLVPTGNDYLRVSTSALPTTRTWSVVEQRIPTPFTINQSNLASAGYIPTLNGVDGGFGELRRSGDFRMYHDAGGSVDDSETIASSRLISRSVWNSQWLLIIPGADLHVDPSTGLAKFAETVSDIKIYFLTYSHQGQ